MSYPHSKNMMYIYNSTPLERVLNTYIITNIPNNGDKMSLQIIGKSGRVIAIIETK